MRAFRFGPLPPNYPAYLLFVIPIILLLLSPLALRRAIGKANRNALRQETVETFGTSTGTEREPPVERPAANAEWEPSQPHTIMLPGDVPLEMVWIPAGTFLMGPYPGEKDSDSWEGPQHQVTLTQEFWLGKYEVTKAQWTAVTGTTPWLRRGELIIFVLDDSNSSAVYVSWNDVQAFISILNTQTGESFRLPSEAEWEYACRAGTTTRFSYGDDPGYSEFSNYAWGNRNAYDYGEAYAHVVGQLLPNPWGLYDMHGNVYEWCEDWYGDYASGPVTDPTGAASGSSRVLRGGSWDTAASGCRSAYRNHSSPLPLYADDYFGFRLAKD